MAAAKKTAKKKVRAKTGAREGTKFEKAMNIVKAHKKDDRGTVLGILKQDLKMSDAGANTYYYRAREALGIG